MGSLLTLRSRRGSILAFILGFLLPTQLAWHSWPSWSYVHGIRIDYLAPYLSIFDVFVCIAGIVYVKPFVQVIRMVPVSVVLALGLLVGLNVLSSFIPMLTLMWWARVIVVSLVFLSLLYASESTLPAFIVGITLVSILELALATMQFAYQSSVQGIWYMLGERAMTPSLPDVAKIAVGGVQYMRPYATFSHPNALGGFYVLLYFFVQWIRRLNLYPTARHLITILSAVCTLLILFSFSKTAITTYVVGNFILLSGDDAYRECLLCRIARSSILILILAVFMIPSGDPVSLTKRLALLVNAVYVIAHHLLWGVGMGTYVLAQSSLPVLPRLAPLYQPVHNIFVLLIAEVGVGGILILSFIAKQVHSLAVGGRYLGAMVTVILMTGMLDHYWLTQTQTRSLLILVTVTALLVPRVHALRREPATTVSKV